MHRTALVILLLFCYWSQLTAEPLEVHVLGYVVSIEKTRFSISHQCDKGSNCFALRIETDSGHIKKDDVILVRYSDQTSFYDPENYELAIDQVSLNQGDHLLIRFVSNAKDRTPVVEATEIRIGD